ncbi:hypothetical protein TTHERM_00756420 (macronuclear) [Tetrahymena thermophila SB210]|uniref:Uncharacterized protein n=1 Tax=Tetrahymena thermophila (strain SB210) TaxID=312017 RepID=I7MCK0_TETTS|nr:hypothetical protein TTHERM_00756420 [Tetrahymena thermophila SB210]EAR84094.1 hypothetical protein TTHERM_00756420 [Tetrahymena thermophila SB210]|eukprot:XP_001031757.1 hypothetical protein TTHERM_00756420 [Tetrahymena thermophila SB210]
MQEDFPCQIGQDSYQMHIEPDEITSQIPINPTQTRFKSLRSHINEVEIPKNQKAIVQLDNNISLYLDVKHSLQENSSFQNDPFTYLAHNSQGLQGINNEIDLVRVSVGTQFELKDNIFTSVVVIQIKDQIYNIISNMSFINQLENSQTQDKSQELSLTKQNLQSLPDDSGKIKLKQMQKRKGSDNSNDSDATQPVISAQTEVLLNAGIYNCTKCGAENKIQLNDSISNFQQNIQQTNVNLVSQDLSQINSQLTEQQSNGIPKQQKMENQFPEEDKGIFSNKIKRVRKQALRSDQSYSQEINNRINEKSKSPLNNQINIKSEIIDQDNRSSLDQQSKSELIPTQQLQIEEPYKYQDYLIRDFCQIYEQILEKQERGSQGSIQLPSESKKFNSDTNQLQTDSNYHQLYQIGKSSQICGQNYSSRNNPIISDMFINQGAQISQQQNSSQSILLKDDQISDQLFLLNKSKKKRLSSISNQSVISNHRQNNSKVMSDITNFDNIPSFSCTSLASSPILNSQNAKILSQNNQIKLYESNQSNHSDSFIQTDSELQKENEVSLLNTQLSFDQKQHELFHNSDGGGDEEIFTDEFIAKADKKNVVKNFVKAFMSEVKKDESILNTLDEFNQKDSKKFSYSQKLKKFQNYMKKSKFNNLFIKQLISNSEYSSIFQSFLLNKADDWLTNSNVQDKETHRKLLKFFQQAIHDEDLLNKLKTLKKSKRNPNSSSLKANQNTQSINSVKTLASSQRIPPFSNMSSQLNEIEYYKNEEKSMSQLPDGELLQSDSKINIEEQKDEYIQTQNAIPSIQQALNGIQISNQYYLIQQHENKNNP